MGEIASKWKSLSDKEKSTWENKAIANANKTKILNKGAVQRTIQAPIEVCSLFRFETFRFKKQIKNCIALTMEEARANLDEEQFALYKNVLAMKREEIKQHIEKELNSDK